MSPQLRQEHAAGLWRGIGTAAIAGALVFFSQWPQDPELKSLISSTAVAALTPLAAFLGLGVADARRNDKAQP